MDSGLKVKRWEIIEGEGEGEGEGEHKAKARNSFLFGDEGVGNLIEIFGKDLDRPGIHFTVALEGGSDAVEFDSFEVIERHADRLVGQFVARGGEAAAGRLTLIVAVADDTGNRAKAKPEACEAMWVMTPTLSLNLNDSTNPPGTLECGIGELAALPNVVTITIAGGSFASRYNFTLESDQPGYHFTPPNSSMYVDSSTLRGTFSVYRDPPQGEVGDPVYIAISVTITGSPPPRPWIPKQKFNSIQVQ